MMRKIEQMIFSVFLILTLMSCQTQKQIPEIPNIVIPSIIVDGELYSTTGKELPIEPDESEIKTAISIVNGTELPLREGEINFPVPKAKYAKINDTEEYVVVMINSEWVRFEKKN